MTTNFATQTGTDKFNSYLVKFKDQASHKKSKDFYHVDVVAEAYSQGFYDGEKSGKKEFVEELMKATADRFTQKATQVYLLTKRAVEHFKINGFHVDAFYLNVTHDNPKALISVPDKQLLDDNFVEFAYSKVFEFKKIFCNLFDSTFDLSLISSDNLCVELMEEDGFDFSETIKKEHE